jgi:hypothetical protein
VIYITSHGRPLRKPRPRGGCQQIAVRCPGSFTPFYWAGCRPSKLTETVVWAKRNGPRHPGMGVNAFRRDPTRGDRVGLFFLLTGSPLDSVRPSRTSRNYMACRKFWVFKIRPSGEVVTMIDVWIRTGRIRAAEHCLFNTGAA